MTGVLMKRRNLDLDDIHTHRVNATWKMKTEMAVMPKHAKDGQPTSRGQGRGTESPSQLQKELTNRHLDLTLQPPALGDNIFLLFKPFSLWYLVTANLACECSALLCFRVLGNKQERNYLD